MNFGRRGLVSELCLGGPDAEINAARFTAAQTHRDDLEAGYGKALTWEPLPGKKAARIADYWAGSVEQIDARDEYIDWFLDSQTRSSTARPASAAPSNASEDSAPSSPPRHPNS